ncbi:MAG TPA: hypothetical protein VMD79_15035, partial [Solirubrobacteraceae bacterium]|nr:hypothetical protein [Solirubrobacteraceae bacterium]
SPTSYAYQWQDCNTSGEGCTNIGGATSSTYKLTASDVGHTIRAVITATNAGGSTPATSAATSVVVTVQAPVNHVLPTITGITEEGQTLTATTGVWTGSPSSYAYQWEDCSTSGEACTSISKATASTYKLTSSDVGHTIRVIVTATNGGGSTPATSERTTVVEGTPAYRTFYISYEGGSESNGGESESSPWKRAPGMQGFEHAYTHHAGDHFIFKGGVTWPNKVFPLDPTGEGTSSSEDVYGAKETWYAGSSYSRPVFNAEDKEIGGHDGDDNFFFDLSAGGEHRNYITVEGIHFKGFNAENPSGGYGTCAAIYFYDGTHDTVNNILFNESPVGDFIEEWGSGANKTSEEARCAAVASDLESEYFGKDESTVENSTIEGLPAEGDEPGGNFFEGIRAVPILKNNVIKGLTQGTFPPQGGGIIEGNRIEDCGYPAFPLKYKGNLHSNAIEFISAGLSVDYEHPYYIYNNVIRGTGDSGSEGGTAECEADSMEGGTYYFWNNVVTHTLGNPVLLGNAEGLGGPAKDADGFLWNNSFEGSGSGGGGCVRGDNSSEWKEIQLENNFCASTYSKFGESNISAKTLTEKDNLVVAPSELTSKHYGTAEAAFPFAPMSEEAPGAGRGEDLSSRCAGQMTSLCAGTTYGGEHEAPPARGLKWDVGAYELE